MITTEKGNIAEIQPEKTNIDNAQLAIIIDTNRKITAETVEQIHHTESKTIDII